MPLPRRGKRGKVCLFPTAEEIALLTPTHCSLKGVCQRSLRRSLLESLAVKPSPSHRLSTRVRMIDTLVLRRLPYPESEDLAWVFRTAREFTAFNHSPGAFIELRRSVQSFTDVSSCSWTGLDLVHGGAPATRVTAQSVSPCFFNMLRVRPILGRDFTPEDEFTSAAPVAIITHSMWTQRFAADPDIIGKAIRLSRQSFVIVGVLPASFEVTEFWGNTEVFHPFLVHADFEAMHDNRWLQLLVRRKPGVSEEQAQLNSR
jgi:hypothetical protein